MALGEATIVVRTAEDRSLVTAWRTVEDVPLVNPLQTAWDLHDLGGADRLEAADRLLSAIRASRS